MDEWVITPYVLYECTYLCIPYSRYWLALVSKSSRSEISITAEDRVSWYLDITVTSHERHGVSRHHHLPPLLYAFVQQLVQNNNKGGHTSIVDPFWDKPNRRNGDSPRKEPVIQKVFICHDVIMRAMHQSMGRIDKFCQIEPLGRPSYGRPGRTV